MAITPLIQEYIVDFASNNNFFFVNAVQGDGHDVRYVQLSLTNNGHPYAIPTDGSVTIVIRGKTPNGDQYLDTESGKVIDSSVIRFELKQSMIWYAGKGKFEVCVVSNSTNQLLTSFPFYVCISESGFDTRGITEQPEFINLVRVLGSVNNAVDSCNKATNAAENATNICKENNEEYESLNVGTSIENAILATERATKAAKNAEQAVIDIQAGLAINDDQVSKTTGWSSDRIEEELNKYIHYQITGTKTVNIPDVLSNDDTEGNVSVASSEISHEYDVNENVNIESTNITSIDDDNGNVSITTE